MHFKVYLLRERGRRRAWRDVKNGKTYTGSLVTRLFTPAADVEPYKVLDLDPTSGPLSTERPPPLYEPVLVGFSPLAFRLRGFERVDGPDGGYSVVQEWHVEEA